MVKLTPLVLIIFMLIPDIQGQDLDTCIFPFTFGGVEYYQCASGKLQLHPWCVTSLNSDGTMATWKDCYVHCSEPFKMVKFQCLYVGKYEHTWQEAEETCQHLDGNLAEVTVDDKNHVKHFLKSRAGPWGRAWMARTQVNNTNKCLMLEVGGYFVSDGGFVPYDCMAISGHYICERRPIVTATPASTPASIPITSSVPGFSAPAPAAPASISIASSAPDEDEPFCVLISQKSCATAAPRCPRKCSPDEDYCAVISIEDCGNFATKCPQKCSSSGNSASSHNTDAQLSTATPTHPGSPPSGFSAPAPAPATPAPVSISIASSAPGPSSCGISTGTFTEVDERIVSGRPAITGLFPWMVHFSFHSQQLNKEVPCGGSLISRRWILTASHCFRFLKPNVNLIAKIGFLNLSNTEPETLTFTINYNDIFRHPNFSESTLVNDIALVRTPTEVALSNKIQTICLGSNHQIPFGGQATAAGWGLLNSSDPEIPNLLHLVELNVIPEKSCTRPQHFICTSTPDGRDTCRGDSGGPLMIQQGTQWYQVGIVSHGPIDCGSNIIPASYTRVPKYLAFISSLTIHG